MVSPEILARPHCRNLSIETGRGMEQEHTACLGQWRFVHFSCPSTQSLSGEPLAPVIGGEGLGGGALFAAAKTPHPRPLSPEYRSEGAVAGVSDPGHS